MRGVHVIVLLDQAIWDRWQGTRNEERAGNRERGTGKNAEQAAEQKAAAVKFSSAPIRTRP